MNEGGKEKDLPIPSPELVATLRTHRKRRPLTPLETAKEIDEFLRRRGRIEQLPVKEDMVREFRSLLKLPRSIQELLGWKGIKAGEIGSESGYWISMLDDVQDQQMLARAVLEKRLSSKEVRMIVRHKNRHRGKSIHECVNSVVGMRPIKQHLFITKISEKTLGILKGHLEEKGKKAEDILTEIFERVLPENSLLSIDLRDKLLTAFFKEEGYNALQNKTQELGTTLNNIVDVLVEHWLRGG